MQLDTIYIRNETRKNEHRTPIVPSDIFTLKQCGYTVYVEKSDTRCFKDVEFEASGAIITDKSWIEFPDALIVGIKELKEEDMDLLENHTHVYFAHCYKNQHNSEKILKRFSNSKSKLYDMEYFLDPSAIRIIAFGFYAGFIGGALGIMQYNSTNNFSRDIKNLTYWRTTYELLSDVKESIMDITRNISIAIIGANGRCGTGVKHLLDFFSIPYHEFGKKDTIQKLENFDIVFNCIHLREEISHWFTKDTVFKKKIVIVDISCDYSNPYNPIAIYNKPTTWEEPVYKYSENVDIIAIENLPSLLPFESSYDFSDNLVYLLRSYAEGDEQGYWKKNLDVFYRNCKNI
jgi:saccharopine dehydrogenase (NAD+, L-lysine-forming)